MMPPAPAPARCGRVAVERAVERADQAADPGHRMADRAQQPLRITDAELDQHGEKCKRDRHVPLRRRRRAAAARRRSRRRPAPVSRRPRTFHRPFDRDQSQSLSAAAPAGRIVRPPAGCRGARRARGASPQQPMARRRRRMSCRRPARRFCCRLSPAWCAPGRAAIVAPTYGEHARAAALAGHSVTAGRAISARSAMPSSSSSPIPTIRTAGFSPRTI